MSSSNNLNVCPRCGTANSLSAKYCYQCGGQLKAPQEPIVCTKCHTVNAGGANYCRICGTDLKKVAIQQKECPRCHRIVSADSNVCSCGYVFANINQEPVQEKKSLFGKKAKPVAETSQVSEIFQQEKPSAIRFKHFLAFLVGLVGVAFCFMPAIEMLEKFVFGIATLNGTTWHNMYAITLLAIDDIKNGVILSGGYHVLLVYGFTALSALSLVWVVLGSIFGVIGGKAKGPKVMYIVWTILTLAVAVVGIFITKMPQVVQGFIFNDPAVAPFQLFGYTAFVVPAVTLIATIITWPKKNKK